jgi:DNA-binding MarR family transcriptional regulator
MSKEAAESATPHRGDLITEAGRQWRAHGWDASEELVAATSIIRAQQIVVGRMEAVLRPHGLSFARFELLVLLYVSSRGALPLGKLSDRLAVHPTSVTSLVDRLEVDDLVRRVDGQPDRRTILATITPKGRATVEKLVPELTSMRFGLGALGETGCRKVTDVLTPLRRDAGDFDD